MFVCLFVRLFVCFIYYIFFFLFKFSECRFESKKIPLTRSMGRGGEGVTGVDNVIKGSVNNVCIRGLMYRMSQGF